MINQNLLLEIVTSAGRTSFPILPEYSELIMVVKTFINPQIAKLDQSNGEKIKFGIDNWNIAYSWVMQLRTLSARESDFPFNTPAFQAGKPVGEFLDATLELCSGCLNFMDRAGIPEALKYRNAWEWWKEILFELETGHLAAFVGADESELAPFRPLKSKRAIEQAMSKELAKLKALENPYSPKMSSFYNLIEAAISINKFDCLDNPDAKKEQYKFRNQAWSGFKTAYISLKSHIHRDVNIAVGFLEEGEIKRKHGGKSFSPKKSSKISLQQSRKKSKNTKDG
ncbi:hypothetical protein [Coleofasciculus sp. H7-2]|uniref:hypothetical protein n=1 Tax=Coleofasciculus sp. H7-2 TaxID=3351545 RepID=UPI003670B32A